MKICPTCKNRFKEKRCNQRYCSDDCRIKKNNEKGRSLRELTKATNHILLNNRHILEGLDGKELSEIEMKIKGFKFEYLTNIYENKAKNRTEYFCYDVGYFFIENGGEVFISVFKDERG